MIQSIINQATIDMLPMIKKLIFSAGDFEKNQMINVVLRESMNSATSLDEMSSDQLNMFQSRLISAFKFNGWL
jgi:hypothetical protein